MNRVSAAVAPPSKSTAYKYSSNLAWSLPASASPNSLYQGLQVDLWLHSISASKCISKLARSRPRSVSLCSLDSGLQVHLWVHSISASKYIVNERWRVYGDTGVTEVDWATGCTYSGDSVSTHLDPGDCVDSHGQVVSYLLTFFLGTWS